ncbi:MAG: hypothetical protein PHN80_05320 [Hespellia sp.]|nr:hypothetical protein [Hespellia sp.]
MEHMEPVFGELYDTEKRHIWKQMKEDEKMTKLEKIYDKIIHMDSDIMMQIDGRMIRYIADTSINGKNSLEAILVLSFIYGYLQAKEDVNTLKDDKE